jgi:DNA modification methylase
LSGVHEDDAGQSVDAVITDPPYYVPINTYVGTRENGYAPAQMLLPLK